MSGGTARLALDDDHALAEMDGDVIFRRIGLELHSQQPLDRILALQIGDPVADIVDRALGQHLVERLRDRIVPGDAEMLDEILGRPAHQPVGRHRKQEAEALYRTEQVDGFTITDRQVWLFNDIGQRLSLPSGAHCP